ncbi:MAG TPA: hypothetical protein DHV24_03545, partial [Candidatus Margulisbacteria bacterium]|nr:hypothetical protein [Candidatus Margulisiibacteriota bacterium]
GRTVMKPGKKMAKKFEEKPKVFIAEDLSDNDDEGYELDESFLDLLNQYKDPALASEIIIEFLKKNNLDPEDFQNAKKMRNIDDRELYARLDELAR